MKFDKQISMGNIMTIMAMILGITLTLGATRYQINEHTTKLSQLDEIPEKVEANSAEISRLRNEYQEDHELLVSIDTKLDLLLKGKIKNTGE
jgi:hypothetical protein